MASGPFYVRRFRDQGRKQGQDKPGDHFAIVTDRWVIDSYIFSTELKDKKPICVSIISGSQGARDEANLLCNNLNAAWEAFHAGRKIEYPYDKGETIKRHLKGKEPNESPCPEELEDREFRHMNRQEMIEAILNNCACGNNDTALSKHVRRNLEKKTDEQLKETYDVFVAQDNETD